MNHPQINITQRALKLCLSLSLLFSAGITAAEEAWTTPEGRYVMMDNYRLYFHCFGEGPVTILFDGGIADSSANWLAIAEQVSGRARTCLFDRAGYGMSDAGPSPRITSVIVAEMDVVLEKAQITGPYLLVGHSFGGYTMQYFASTHAEEVMGVVLVESSHPEQVERLKELDTMPGRKKKTLVSVPDEDRERMSDAQKYWSLLNATRKSIYAQMQELRYFKDSAEEVRGLHLGFPDVPLAVLTRGVSQLPSLDENYSLETVWQDMQKELGSLSANSWQVIVEESGHSIHLEAPEVVVENIDRVLDTYPGIAEAASANLSAKLQ